MTRTCERCEKEADFFLYSAYDNLNISDSVHPLVHRYPAPMYGACAVHVALLLGVESRWVVSRERLPMVAKDLRATAVPQ